MTSKNTCKNFGAGASKNIWAFLNYGENFKHILGLKFRQPKYKKKLVRITLCLKFFGQKIKFLDHIVVTFCKQKYFILK